MKINKKGASGKEGSFSRRNQQAGGYLLKAKATKAMISLARGLLLFGLCFMIIQPMLTRLSTSLMQEKDLYDSTVVLVPRNPTLDNFRIVFDLTTFPKSMINTLWTTLLVSVCQVIACTFVGYGFARYNFPLKKFWFGCVIAVIVIPPQTISTSLYITFTNFDILGLFKADGLYIYMLRQYFRGIPKSLEEAAFVDGCSTLQTFVQIMLPDAMPTILSCFLFSFVWQWTDLFYTRNFLNTPSRPIFSTELSTIVSRMSRYFSSDASKPIIVPVGRQQQLISIGVLICCIPLIILYVFTQRTFVQSIAMTGSKE